jgi:ubiquinone/menaquinone biosynthesis C-methylase UbiE
MYSSRLSKDYSQFREQFNPVDLFFLEQLETTTKGKDTLDIGCGNGKFLFEVESLEPGNLVGIDNSKTMIDLAKEEAVARGSRSVLEVMDAKCLDFQRNTFDLIVSTFTIHHIEDLDKFFKSVNTLLRSNGLFMATFNTFELTNLNLLYKQALIDLRSGQHAVTVSNTIRTDKQYLRAATKAGLCKITYMDIPNPVPSLSKLNEFDINEIKKLNNIFAVFQKL